MCAYVRVNISGPQDVESESIMMHKPWGCFWMSCHVKKDQTIEWYFSDRSNRMKKVVSGGWVKRRFEGRRWRERWLLSQCNHAHVELTGIVLLLLFVYFLFFLFPLFFSFFLFSLTYPTGLASSCQSIVKKRGRGGLAVIHEKKK